MASTAPPPASTVTVECPLCGEPIELSLSFRVSDNQPDPEHTLHLGVVPSHDFGDRMADHMSQCQGLAQ